MSRVVTIFGKPGCARCESTKRKIDHLVAKRGLAPKVQVDFHDMDTPDGMAEAAFQDVGEIPTVIVSVDGNDARRWDGEIPRSDEVFGLLIGDNPSDAAD